MATGKTILIGASAGGVSALQALVGALPGDLDAAVLVVLHMAPDAPSVLAAILNRVGPLPAQFARKGEPILNGHVYVAPPGRHLIVEDGHMNLHAGPKENRFRPSIDVLFRSAAFACQQQAIGVVLTGLLDDGTAGLKAIKDCGGTAVVQDPAEARFPSMPESALKHVAVDYCLPLAGIAALLGQLSEAPMQEPPGMPTPKQVAIETRIQLQGYSDESELNQLGHPSVYACPECHGALWEIQEEQLVRYRCRTGHAYTGRSLLAEQAEAKEAAMWSLLRGLEELESLATRLAVVEATPPASGDSQDLRAYAGEIRQKLALMRRIVTGEGTTDTAPPGGAGNPPSDAPPHDR